MADKNSITLFNQLNDAENLEFLQKALENSTELQKQFITYFENRESKSAHLYEDFERLVAEAIKDYEEALNEIDFENPDLDDYSYPRDHYVPEYEAARTVVEDEVNGYFDGFFLELGNHLRQCDLTRFFADFTGLLIACNTVEVYDPYYNLSDPNEFFNDVFQKKSATLQETIRTTVYHSNLVEEAAKLVFKSFIKGSATDNPTSQHDILLAQLLQKSPEKCSSLNEFLNQEENLKPLFPKTSVVIFKNSHETASEWPILAEPLSTVDKTVAKELLDHYFDKKDKKAFHRIAIKAWPYFQYDLLDYLAEKVDEDFNPAFAIKVLKRKVDVTDDIKAYKRLKKLLTAEETDLFRNSFSDNNSGLYLKLLEHDGLFLNILHFAQKQPQNTYSLAKNLKPIAGVFPDECFQMAKNAISLESEYTTGRDHYRIIAEFLKMLADATRNPQPVKDFALSLTLKYNRRTALKEEFKQRKLI